MLSPVPTVLRVQDRRETSRNTFPNAVSVMGDSESSRARFFSQYEAPTQSMGENTTYLDANSHHILDVPPYIASAFELTGNLFLKDLKCVSRKS